MLHQDQTGPVNQVPTQVLCQRLSTMLRKFYSVWKTKDSDFKKLNNCMSLSIITIYTIQCCLPLVLKHSKMTAICPRESPLQSQDLCEFVFKNESFQKFQRFDFFFLNLLIIKLINSTIWNAKPQTSFWGWMEFHQLNSQFSS